MESKVKITWNEKAIKKLAEDAGRNAMEIARGAATQVRCLDHGEIVRVVDRDPRTGGFKLVGCCDAAIRTAQEAIRRAFR